MLIKKLKLIFKYNLILTFNITNNVNMLDFLKGKSTTHILMKD